MHTLDPDLKLAPFNASTTKPTIICPDLLHFGAAMLATTLTGVIPPVLSDIVGIALVICHETFMFFFPFMSAFNVLIILASYECFVRCQSKETLKEEQ